MWVEPSAPKLALQSRISRRSAIAISPAPPKDTGQCLLFFARGVLIGTVHRLARASLSPSGPSPLPRSSPRIPPVVPLIPHQRYYGGDTEGLAPGQQGERGHLGRRDAGPVVASWQSFSRIHLAARHFRYRRFPASRLRPIVAGAPNRYPGFSHAWLVVEYGASGSISAGHAPKLHPTFPFQKLVCVPDQRNFRNSLGSSPAPGVRTGS